MDIQNYSHDSLTDNETSFFILDTKGKPGRGGCVLIKSKINFVITLLIGMLVLFGCNNSGTSNDDLDENKETVQKSSVVELKTVTVEELTEEGYETIKVVEDTGELKSIGDILENAVWEENIEVSMATPPEYRFRLNSSNYAIWVTPNGDRLEIVIEGEAKYIKMPENKSETLLKLITGDKFEQ
jgi:hypothetical protein